jgi:putative membrane protein
MAIFGSCPMAGGFFGMGYGWLFQLAIFVIFFLVVWWLLRSNPSFMKGESKPGESPSDILKRRLAKGEITKKEYAELKKEIE